MMTRRETLKGLGSLVAGGLCASALSAEGGVAGTRQIVVLYYSVTYGNTKKVAEAAHQALGGELFRIETAVPYPEDPSVMDRQVRAELKKGTLPAIKPLKLTLQPNAIVLLGTPTWWFKMAPAVRTWLTSADLAGRTFIPFSTHAGWPGSVLEDMSALAKERGATVLDGQDFRFTAENDQQVTDEAAIQTWAKRLPKQLGLA